VCLPLDEVVVALVTGAARSYGRAVALSLARLGPVVLLDAPAPYTSLASPVSSDDELHGVADESAANGGEALAVPADVRDLPAVEAAVARARAAFGAITTLVVCAGVVSAAQVARMTRSEWDEVLDTNLTGAYHVTRAVVPEMVAAGAGRVVFVTGPEARRGFASLSHVAAASWALIGMAKTVALEVAAAGVGVNVICASPPDSLPLTSIPELQTAVGATGPQAGAPPWEQIAAVYPQGRAFVEPQEVAAAVEFLLTDDAASWTGAVIDISMGTAARNSA
jgi:NAD(P)-dependent dehydrogenase (short-subunit alcohol dehydrogenase family)